MLTSGLQELQRTVRRLRKKLVMAVLLAYCPVVSQSSTLLTIPKAKATPGYRVDDGLAEAQLIDIYRLISRASTREALRKAEKLVVDYPHFQLAQLVYGDLLTSLSRPIQSLGDVPADLAQAGSQNLQALRAESHLRMAAIKERPPLDATPSQFIALSRRNKHAIAVDTAKARLYLFENSDTGFRLLADYYISVGKAGVEKSAEGDQRTPLGVYFITSSLDPKSLKDLYGSGALPVNYPNALDRRRGKSGGGIWLHGTPSSQFTRAPFATDGCVAVANPDLNRIIRTVEIRTTPVLIAKNLTWVHPVSLSIEKQTFEKVLKSWVDAKTRGEPGEVLKYYAEDFSAEDKTFVQFKLDQLRELAKIGGRSIRLSDVSLIRWSDEAQVMVATFGEVVTGEKSGRTVRQYWQRRADNWKIIFEGVIG